ncbi:TonB-dependent receptor plug domain protein [Verrucomicrobiia bacterium DG1235]|nr:TonB-dependent receptor plug domain protein [Verrucomicrobiae bacterium DG1235]
MVFVGLLLAWSACLRSDAKVLEFDVAGGKAVETLKVAAIQGDVEILISVEASSNVQTNTIRGRFEVQEALSLMLEGTPLVAVPVSNGKAYGIIERSTDLDTDSSDQLDLQSTKEEPPMNFKKTKKKIKIGSLFRGLVAIAAPGLVATEGVAQVEDVNVDGDEVFELSPFEVKNSDNDIGYYSENTLAGSRLNSSISDLASSITVVTSQQLEDTAAVDINDVFLYEANTEGMGNYTAYEVDKNGAVQDLGAGRSNGGIASGPSTSNRVRGIAPADTARDYFPSIARIPFDAYNTQTIEINRGPNSILFGLGSAAGIVNQSQSKAVVGSNSGEVQVRFGSWDSFRASASINRTIVENRLAVNVSVLNDEKGYRRKPSYDRTNREYIALTYRPTDSTSVRGTYERYRNENRRPNNVTPRDMVTSWVNAGSPAWNPLTRTFTINGATSAAIDSDSDLPNGLGGQSGRPLFYYDQGELEGFYQRRFGNEPGNVGGGTVYRQMVSNGDVEGPLYVLPGVTDRSVYDWESINIVSSNVGEDEATIQSLEIDQKILPNLYLNLGFFEESFESRNSYFIGQQTGATIQIDPNTHMLDGSANPYFGRAFVETREPDEFLQTEDNSNIRATIAYEMDFTQTDNWTRHFGSHRAMGLASSRDYDTSYYRWRQMVVSDNPWVNPSNLSAGAGGAIYRRMYLGGTDGTVDYDPGIILNGPLSTSFSVAYPTEAVAADAPLDSFVWTTEAVALDNELHFVSPAGNQDTDSEAFVLQSHFWDKKIVTTLGWRSDDNRGRSSNFPAIDPVTGRADPAEVGTDWSDWQEVSGSTSTRGIVVKPTEWLNFHYNESDNFTPEGVSYDIRDGSFLPLPTGEGKDWGIGFNLFEGKLYANLNFFEAAQVNSRVGGTGTFIWRMGYFDEDFFGDWAAHVADLEGLSGSAADARVQEITQWPANFAQYNDNVVGTSTLQAEGTELQVIYNPLPNWNFKFNVAQQETVFSDIAPEYEAWKAERLAVWQNASSSLLPDGFQNFWDYDNDNAPYDIGTKRNALHGTLNTPEAWFNTNVDANMALQKKLEGKATPNQREWRWNVITNYKFNDGRFKGLGVGGSARWEDAAIIGYLGGTPDADGVLRELDPNRPVYSGEEFHVDLWASYSMPVLSDKANLKFQLNVRDALESGGLEAIGINPNGQKTAFRIVDPRRFYLTTTLEF